MMPQRQPGSVNHSPPAGQWDWQKNQWDTPPERPQDALRQVKMDELADKYAKNWLITLFSPFGMREVLEMEVLALMQVLHQPYESIMSMPISRRKRFTAELADRQQQSFRKLR